MNNFCLLVCLFIVTACAPSVRLPEVVKIPVPVQCPAPKVTVRPKLAISKLSPSATPDQYVRAVESSLEALMGYAEELERTLDGYRPPGTIETFNSQQRRK